MIFDIILILLFLLLIFLGYRRGAAKTLLGITSSFVSYLAATSAAKFLAVGIYNTFIGGNVKSEVSSAVNGAEGSLSDALSSLPEWIRNVLGMTSGDIAKDITAGTPNLAEKAAVNVNSAVQPIFEGFISVLLTILLFLVFSFLIKKFIVPPLLAILQKLPIVKTADKVLGAVLGAVEALLTVCMLAYLFKLVLPYISNDYGFLNESTIYNSFIFYHFYSGNIFAILTSWIH